MQNLRTAKVALLVIAVGSANGPAQTASVDLNGIADSFVNQELNYDPTVGYADVQPQPCADQRPEALSQHDSAERAILKALLALSITSFPRQVRATYANLRERYAGQAVISYRGAYRVTNVNFGKSIPFALHYSRTLVTVDLPPGWGGNT